MRLRSKVRTLGPIRCEFVEPDPRKYRWRTGESAPGAWSWEVEVWTFVRPRPVSPGPLYGWKQLASGGPEPVAILAESGCRKAIDMDRAGVWNGVRIDPAAPAAEPWMRCTDVTREGTRTWRCQLTAGHQDRTGAATPHRSFSGHRTWMAS